MDKYEGFSRNHEVPEDHSTRSHNASWWAGVVSSPNNTKEKLMQSSDSPKRIGYNDGFKRSRGYGPSHEDSFDKRRRLDVSSRRNPSCSSESLFRQSPAKQPEDYERSSRDCMRDDRYDLRYNYKGSSESDVGSKVDYGMYAKLTDRYADDSFVSKQSVEFRKVSYNQEKGSGQEYSQKDSVNLNKINDSGKFNRGYYQDSRINRDRYISQDRCQERYERPHSNFILNKTDDRDKYSRETYPDSRINVNSSLDLNPEIYGQSSYEFKPNKSSDIDKYSRGYSGSDVNRNPSQHLNAENYTKLSSDDFTSNKSYECSRDYYTDSRNNRNQLQDLDPEKYARFQNENDKYFKSSYTDSRINRSPCSSYEFSSRVGSRSTEQNTNYDLTVINQKGDTRKLEQFYNPDMSKDSYLESVSKYGRDVLEPCRFSSDFNPEKGRGRYMKDQFPDDRQVDHNRRSNNYFETVYNEDNFRGNHRANDSVVSCGDYRKGPYPEINLKPGKDNDLQSNRDLPYSNFKALELLDRVKKIDEELKVLPGHDGPRENYIGQKKCDGTDNLIGSNRNSHNVPVFVKQDTSIGSGDDSGLRNDDYSQSRIRAGIHSQNTNSDKNNKGAIERTDKNTLGTFNQSLPKSDGFRRTSFPVSCSDTYRTKNIETICNRNIVRSRYKFDARKDRNVVQSSNIQLTNKLNSDSNKSDQCVVISDSNKSDERILSASDQVNTQSNVALNIKTEEDKNVDTKNVDLCASMKQKHPTVQLTVKNNEKPPPDGGDCTDDNSCDSDEEKDEEGWEEWEEPGGGKKKDICEGLTEEELKKYSSVINKYAVTGPLGRLLIIAAVNENAGQTIERTKAMMKKGYGFKMTFDFGSRMWVCKFKMCGTIMASYSNFKKTETKRATERLAVQTLQKHYYTLLMRNEYFSHISTVVHVSGKFGPPVDRKSVTRKNRYARSANVKEAKQRINEFVKSDVVQDLVFSFMFPPPARRTLYRYGQFLGLRVRKLGPKKFRFLVMTKFQDIWKIIEGITNNDATYTNNYKLVPPGRYDLMRF